MLDRLETKHLKFAFLVTGHDIEPPPSTAHIVNSGSELREMQGMPAIKNVDGGNQDDALSQSSKAGRDQKRIGRFVAKSHLCAIAALAHPRRQREDQVESQFFDQHRVVRI